MSRVMMANIGLSDQQLSAGFYSYFILDTNKSTASDCLTIVNMAMQSYLCTVHI